MAPPTVIPDENHISRYCSFGTLTESGRVSGKAFRIQEPRPGEEPDKSLSINWLERLHPDSRAEQLVRLRADLELGGLTLRKSGKIAVLNCGKTRADVLANSTGNRELQMLLDELPGRPSHGGIFGYGVEEYLIADLIAETVIETHPAIENAAAP